MRKLYSVLAIAAITLSANARVTVEQTAPIRINSISKINHNLEGIKFADITSPIVTSVSSISDFEGIFEWYYYRALGDGAEKTGSLEFKAVSDTEVSMSGFQSNMSVTGTADLNAGTLTFNPQALPDVNIYGIGMCQAKFETAAIVGSTTKITPDTPIVFTRTSSGYDVESTQMFGVSVYSEGSLIGWLNLAGYNEIVGSDWEDAGTGTLTESFISGTYTQAGSSTKTVSVQVSKNNKNLIRICRYYSSIDNTLEIDMTNPQNIVVPIQDTGVEDNVDGKTMIASYSALWPNEMEDGTYIILSGNTITFPASSMLLNWPDAPADSQYETDANTWYISGRVASTLVLPGTVGIEDIAADSEDTANAPVEYFNLQGMKVSNPVSGQIYITRQGNKVTKVLVK